MLRIVDASVVYQTGVCARGDVNLRFDCGLSARACGSSSASRQHAATVDGLPDQHARHTLNDMDGQIVYPSEASAGAGMSNRTEPISRREFSSMGRPRHGPLKGSAKPYVSLEVGKNAMKARSLKVAGIGLATTMLASAGANAAEIKVNQFDRCANGAGGPQGAIRACDGAQARDHLRHRRAVEAADRQRRDVRHRHPNSRFGRRPGQGRPGCAGNYGRRGDGRDWRCHSKGAPKPDISTADAFKRALLNAKAIAYSKEGQSGTAMARIIIERNGSLSGSISHELAI